MIDDDDIADLVAERNARRAYQRQISTYPDSRDPDHPDPLDEDDQ